MGVGSFVFAWQYVISTMTVCKTISFSEIPIKITGVLYEQNKSNKTIKRHQSDAVVY